MPVFKKINLFFIHIPKTGGTSVESYLYYKCKLKRTIDTLFTGINCNVLLNLHSLQHSTYSEIKNNSCFDFNIDKLKIITIVRNPYDRLISELFFLHKITISMSKKEIEKQIKLFLDDDNLYDHHKLPQYKFITHNNNLIKTTIMKTESLTEDMHNYGFTDFYTEKNKTHRNDINYKKLYTNKAKEIVYTYYKQDFALFDYVK